MRFTILAGSPRENGNTHILTEAFIEGLAEHSAEHSIVRLHDKRIAGCTACRACQRDWSHFGCSIRDDMQAIFSEVLAADTLVLATPIYSWYCTAPMKAALDRLMYGMNKFYGDEKGPSLWAGKRVALLITCGYRPEKGADLFIEGMKRYCKHSGLAYAGDHVERDPGYKTTFPDTEKLARTRRFAKVLAQSGQEAGRD